MQYSQENTWLKRVPKEILRNPFYYKIPLVAASGCPVFQWSLHCALKQILENKTLKEGKSYTLGNSLLNWVDKATIKDHYTSN